jgi:uncharacterized delta-60 repeat protein
VQTIGSDSKVLLGGAFTSVGGQTRNRIARLDANGDLDSGFNPGVSGGASPVVYSIAVQGNNFVLLGGDFTTVAGQNRNRVARLTAGGGLDNGFNPNVSGGTAPVVHSVVVQPDGKIVIAGKFTTVVGSDELTFGRNHVARLKTDGTVDTGNSGFDPGNAVGGTDPVVYSVAVQSDGKVVVAGQFTTVITIEGNQFINSMHVSRLHSNGSVDGSFRPGPLGQVSQYGTKHSDINITPYVRSVAMQADGLIVIGGEFTTYEVPGSSQPLSADARVARIGGQ